MALYFLSYDLRKDKDYRLLFEELRRFSAVRILKSEWCFDSNNTSAADLRDYFKRYVDNDDGLSVAKVTDWATYNVQGTPGDL